tara:strand:- start:144 stop:1205 length:1062 start_codon:yes stop_codon:yes gene_type:complete
MNNINKLFDTNLNYINKNRKAYFLRNIAKLTKFHINKSKKYKKILNFLKFNKKIIKIEDVPFIPSRLFKEIELKSIPNSMIFKTLTSSGTSTGQLSKIYLDKENAVNQIKALNKIMFSILGSKRLPMLIIDRDPKVEDRSTFNAKSAAIYGFSLFGRSHTFLLNKNNEINYDLLNKFIKKFGDKKFFIFGFTSSIFEFLITKLNNQLLKLKFKNGILLHGGGWKKMIDLKIDNVTFKKKLLSKLSLKKVYNYYGLIEQTGSIFLECQKCGHFVTSIFSDILIRDKNFKLVNNGERGFIQLLSLLPTSYPGHSILTEDIGEIVKKNNCSCSKLGKQFIVYGRAEESEIRGCSDV